MKVTIIGAGIGGLAAAIALQKAGYQVEVYEQASVLQGIGAGISLWANATAVLEKLDLLDAAVDKSAVYTELKIRNESGELLMKADIEKYSPVSICIHRGDLIDLLKQNCAPDTIHLGKTFERFEQTKADVKVFFGDGTKVQTDILIGADGINSRVRAQIKGDSKPVYRGYAIWRGIVEYEAKGFDANCPTETWGTGNRFGLVPVGKNRFYWYATNNQPEGEILPPLERKKQLLKIFHDWHAPISQILESIRAETVLHNDCYDRTPERGWCDDKVCLIGDAAHSTTPNMGQGGCLALEDALVLTRCMQSTSSQNEAFKEFERLRFARTKLINERSLLIGRVGQWESQLAVKLRNILTKFTTQRTLEWSFDSIYKYNSDFPQKQHI